MGSWIAATRRAWRRPRAREVAKVAAGAGLTGFGLVGWLILGHDLAALAVLAGWVMTLKACARLDDIEQAEIPAMPERFDVEVPATAEERAAAEARNQEQLEVARLLSRIHPDLIEVDPTRDAHEAFPEPKASYSEIHALLRRNGWQIGDQHVHILSMQSNRCVDCGQEVYHS